MFFPRSAPILSTLSNWTCTTCLRREIAGNPRGNFVGQIVKTGRSVGRAARIQSSAHQSAKIHSSTAQATRATPKPKRRRRVLLATSTGTALLAGAITFTDDGQHYARAVQRTSRVVQTLAVNIYDYRVSLKHEGDDEVYAKNLKACHKRCAERTLVTLEKNGSIFIKLGQHLSSLNYLLPVEWCDTFIPLQDKCPVSSFESVEDMVKNDTGQSLSEFFDEFEEQPIGAASLAQVHRAVVKGTGQQVAVKVQHPALDEWAHLDLALTRFTFATLKRYFPEYDLTWLAEEMEISLPQELDFNREGQNAMRARSYFAGVKNTPVIIPRVLWAKRRILVMDYVTGHRPDDLEYLDSHGIDRDEVSAALARIFNEMIFGTDAPLHCDPHGGNIAIRHNPNRWGKSNFDVILYDHGLYRDIPLALRRSYAKLWLAVLDVDVPRMRQYAFETAGVKDADFELFASAITGRDFSVLEGDGVQKPRNTAEKKAIGDALGDGMLAQLVQLLGRVPRVLLLILKTNDLTRSLDDGLKTRQGSMRTFLILGRYAARTVYEEQLEGIRGSLLFWPPNWIVFLSAWTSYARVGLKLGLYERWLGIRRLLGMEPIVVDSFQRDVI